MGLGHLIRRLHSKVREAVKRVTRSPKWRAVEKAHLKAQPACRGCGSMRHLQVHHVKPFHLEPELELDPRNLVTACMDVNECHLRICHGDNFKAFNPNVLEDLSASLTWPIGRAAVWARAKAARQLQLSLVS